jgi:hypothetical protein
MTSNIKAVLINNDNAAIAGGVLCTWYPVVDIVGGGSERWGGVWASAGRTAKLNQREGEWSEQRVKASYRGALTSGQEGERGSCQDE